MDAEITDRSDDAHDAHVAHDSDAGGRDPAAWRALQSAMASSIATSLDDVDWAQATLFWSEIGDPPLSILETLAATGHAGVHAVLPDFDTLAGKLRRAMATPDRGAWLSISLVLDAGGDFTARFNYDRRVYDNPASPFAPGAGGDIPSDEAYARDLARHPRSPRYTPAWMPGSSTSVAAPYDVLADAWGWPGVFASIEQQSGAALSEQDPAVPLDRESTDRIGRRVLGAVVADVLEPHRVATLLRLHREAVERRLLTDVDGVDTLDPELSLVAAREASTPALLAVEAGVYGIVGDLVRARLAA